MQTLELPVKKNGRITINTSVFEIVKSIPKSRRRSALMHSKLWQNIEAILEMAEDRGTCPFEEIVKISVDNQEELTDYKNPVITLTSAIKNALREKKLQKIIRLAVRGTDVYLSGA